MRYHEIVEARRNPEQNPKVSVNQYITQALASAQPLPNTGFKNLFVSFTDLPKLGINPGSRYNTPIGIYAYPAEYVIYKTTPFGNIYSEPTSTMAMTALPFAGGKPWANIFRARSGANIIDIGKFTEAQYNEYCDKLKALLTKLPIEYRPQPLDSDTATKYIDTLMDAANKSARVNTPGGKFWYVTMRLSEVMNTNKTTVAWNEIFRRLGIDGFVDPDREIIHPSEPTQAVFFSGRAVELLDTVANKYSPTKMKSRQEHGKERDEIFTTNMQLMRKLLNDNNIQGLITFLHAKGLSAGKYFKRLDRAMRLDLIKTDASLFGNIRKVATPEEFKTAFLIRPSIVGNLHSLDKLVPLDEFKLLLKKVAADNVESMKDRDRREIANDIWWLLRNSYGLNYLHEQTDLLKSLIDFYPLIWSKFYDEIGVERLDRDIVEYALKVAKRENYSEEVLHDIRSFLYNSYT
jgi:hypothetical protein